MGIPDATVTRIELHDENGKTRMVLTDGPYVESAHAETGWSQVGLLYLESFIEPFGTLWFIYLLPIFFVVTKLTRKAPPSAIWIVAAALEMAHVATGWTVIDEFCARFVYFYSGYWLAGYVFALSNRVSTSVPRFASSPYRRSYIGNYELLRQ